MACTRVCFAAASACRHVVGAVPCELLHFKCRVQSVLPCGIRHFVHKHPLAFMVPWLLPFPWQVQYDGVACAYMVLLLSLQGLYLWFPLSVADTRCGVRIVDNGGMDDAEVGKRGMSCITHIRDSVSIVYTETMQCLTASP